MGHYEIVPGATRLVCGGNSAYGLVSVRDTDNPAQPPVEVRVDTNWNDGTEPPRIILPDGTSVNIDDVFLGAYQRLTRGEGAGTPDQQRACSEMEVAGRAATPAPASEDRSPSSPLWLIVPTLFGSTQYIVDRSARHDMSRIPAQNGFGAMGSLTEMVFYGGTQGLFVGTYVPIHRRLSSTAGWAADGVCLGGGVAFVAGSFAQRSGEGTPELSTGLTLGTTCISAMIYGNDENSRTPERFWPGLTTQLVWAGLGLGLGYGGVGRRELPTGSSIYAPADAVPGSHDDRNPYRGAPFPNIDRDMMILGYVHLAGATINLVDYLLWSGPSSDSPVRSVSVAPAPGGATVQVGGTF